MLHYFLWNIRTVNGESNSENRHVLFCFRFTAAPRMVARRRSPTTARPRRTLGRWLPSFRRGDSTGRRRLSAARALGPVVWTALAIRAWDGLCPEHAPAVQSGGTASGPKSHRKAFRVVIFSASPLCRLTLRLLLLKLLGVQLMGIGSWRLFIKQP